MVGIVVASHGLLAKELLRTAAMIIGELQQATACSIEPGTPPQVLRDRIAAAVHEVDTGDGVIVFSDLLGGSPCTQSLLLCRENNLEVLTGVNLPMVLKADALRRTVSLVELARTLAEYGRNAITCATAKLRGEQTPAADRPAPM